MGRALMGRGVRVGVGLAHGDLGRSQVPVPEVYWRIGV